MSGRRRHRFLCILGGIVGDGKAYDHEQKLSAIILFTSVVQAMVNREKNRQRLTLPATWSVWHGGTDTEQIPEVMEHWRSLSEALSAKATKARNQSYVAVALKNLLKLATNKTSMVFVSSATRANKPSSAFLHASASMWLGLAAWIVVTFGKFELLGYQIYQKRMLSKLN